MSQLYKGVVTLEDNDILDLFFAREEAGIEQAKLKYGSRLFHSANNILRSTQDAEECVNDTFLKAWQVIPPSRPTMFGAFLAKISRNLAINIWRSKHASRRGGGDVGILLSELEDCIPTLTSFEPEVAYEAEQLTKAINSCVAAMDKTTRVAFILRYFHGQSVRDICERFKVSESKVKSILFRARKKLKAHLEKEGVAL